MLVEGLVLGGLTFAGFAVTYSRLPAGVKVFIQKHPLLSDMAMVTFFYTVMGMSVTAHFAVAAMSVMTIMGLHVVRNKEQWQFLFDGIDRLKGMWDELMQKAKELNDAHMAKKEQIVIEEAEVVSVK